MLVLLRTFSFVLISLATTLAFAWPRAGRMLPDVSHNLEQIATCLESGRVNEARALAQMTLLSETVTFAYAEDPHGVVDEALARWTEVLGGEVCFERSSPSRADLWFSFKHAVPMAGRDVLGLATTRRRLQRWSGGEVTYKVTGSLEVATLAPNGLPLARETVLNTTMHEIGHFLGLQDTCKVGELMGPIDLRRPVLSPSLDELDAIADLRSEASYLLQLASLPNTPYRFWGR